MNIDFKNIPTRWYQTEDEPSQAIEKFDPTVVSTVAYRGWKGKIIRQKGWLIIMEPRILYVGSKANVRYGGKGDDEQRRRSLK